MLIVLESVFIALIVCYAIILIRDLACHREELKSENGNIFAIGAATAFIQFLAVFGVSDFNVSIPIYRAAKWVDDRRMPGTLLTATVIPGAIISILYISNGVVSIRTLLYCIIAQSFGSVIGGKIIAGLNGMTTKRIMAIALLVSSVIVLVKMLWGNSAGGSLNGFDVKTLLWVTPVYFMLGVVNAMGFGVKALSMALLLTLGLSANCVLAVILSCAGVGSFCGAVQFIRNDCYQRKIAFVSSVAGTFGVIIGSLFVKGLRTDILQWIMLVIMMYTAITMLKPTK
jgi:uncharacterized membrane protein YfcA